MPDGGIGLIPWWEVPQEELDQALADAKWIMAENRRREAEKNR